MSRNELLVLRKILIELLDKEFIYINSSPVTDLILFIRKLSESLYFYINYHTLNQITKKNHYSLSLIKKTLAQISKIIYFIKLDIVTVFHNICITESDK